MIPSGLIVGLTLLAAPVLASPLSQAPASPVGTGNAVAQTGAAPLISGVVRDPAGAVVPGATIVIRTASGAEIATESEADGRFSVLSPVAGDVTLIVRARGFADVRMPLGAAAARDAVQVSLVPATVAETITVTPSRQEQQLGLVPASVSVVDRTAIERSPASVADDLLRQLPTFSLFRRTSSLASHPTAQGVSLRGIGPSGVSRTLVLLDGVPFNDPFGGWVYWTRVPLVATDRVEVVEGPSSSLYGSYALGGVINVMTSAPARRHVELKTQYGSLNSPQFDVVASDVYGRLGIVATASAFDTEGYPTVVASERGIIDTNAAVDYRNLSVKLQYDASSRLRAYMRAGYFAENRDNGKNSTFDRSKEENDTRWTSVNGGVTMKLRDESELQAALFTDFETFHSNFLAVPQATPARSVGRMTLRQTVPTTGVGGSVQWSRPFGPRHAVTAGSDLRWVKGESQELGLDAQTGLNVTLDRKSGGRQRSFGLFGQDLIALTPELALTLSARLDSWRNYEGHNLETTVATGAPAAGNRPELPDRSDTVVSPRVAASYRVSNTVNVWGSFGTGFRAPTLNELYRQFRVGTVLTLANDQLGPERLKGAELGIRVTPAANVIWRATWFDNRVRDAVSNVTLSITPGLETRQRQNLGLTRVAGLQTDVEYRPTSQLSFSAAYVYNRATVREADAAPALVGLTLPQVPRHRGSVEVAYSNPRYLTLVVQVQGMGRQFDDDLNVRVVPGRTEAGLPAYGVASIHASRDLGQSLQVFAGVQNLGDQEYFVGTLPTTVGSPRLVHVGVRLRWNGR